MSIRSDFLRQRILQLNEGTCIGGGSSCDCSCVGTGKQQEGSDPEDASSSLSESNELLGVKSDTSHRTYMSNS